MNISGPRRKFAEGIVSGLSAAAAYRQAYPNSAPGNAHKLASRLTGNPDVQAEIARLPSAADQQAGSAVLNLMEKRIFLARVVRAAVANLPEDSDLWVSIKRTESGTEYRLPDKLAAVKVDNDLAGEGSEAAADDAFAALLGRIMQ
ncbi:MAG: hypothetical protein ACO1QR_09565 [Chthoniobacteraceae bacterium]